VVGTALHQAGYDYPGQVLFNAHAGVLWARFSIEVRRQLATAAGLSRAEAARQVTVLFAKVAEFQTRGVVHFHAIIRLDGPDGSSSPPPAWATVARLETAIRQAARMVRVPTAASRVTAGRVLRWGRQIDVRSITVGGGDVSDVVIARYVAKYATKSTEAAGIILKPLHCRACAGTGVTIGRVDVRHGLCRTCGGTGRRRGVWLDHLNGHVRALVEVCWRLGGQNEHADLHLRRWAHQLGYHGHFATKSRTYSTTFAALRAERHDWSSGQYTAQLGLNPDTPLLVVADWRYTGRAGGNPIGGRLS
jgi:hypothetical protein